MTRTLAAILGGLKDVAFGRLTLLALLNLAVALALTLGAAAAVIRYVVPLIPEGSGWLSYLSTAGEVAASLVLIVLALVLSPAASMIVGGLLFDLAAFILLNGFLMGREYATLAAQRHMSYEAAVELRKRHGLSIFTAGLACSVIPFFAPLVGASAMARLINALPRPDAAGRPPRGRTNIP